MNKRNSALLIGIIAIAVLAVTSLYSSIRLSKYKFELSLSQAQLVTYKAASKLAVQQGIAFGFTQGCALATMNIARIPSDDPRSLFVELGCFKAAQKFTKQVFIKHTPHK